MNVVLTNILLQAGKDVTKITSKKDNYILKLRKTKFIHTYLNIGNVVVHCIEINVINFKKHNV